MHVLNACMNCNFNCAVVGVVVVYVYGLVVTHTHAHTQTHTHTHTHTHHARTHAHMWQRMNTSAYGTVACTCNIYNTGATFLSCPMPFQRSTDSDGPNCVFLLDTIGLRTMEESRPSDSSPCCDYACDLSYINYAHSNQL